MDLRFLVSRLCKKCNVMKDFANRKKSKKRINKGRQAFRSRKSTDNTISRSAIISMLAISVGLASISFFYFNTDVVSVKTERTTNSVIIDFPSSLKEDSILIEIESENEALGLCQYYVQIGAYGNKKYAMEAENMLKSDIQNISINDVYSTSNPGKLLNSVISGPYENKSAANNVKEKITKAGFDPRLRTLCKKK